MWLAANGPSYTDLVSSGRLAKYEAGLCASIVSAVNNLAPNTVKSCSVVGSVPFTGENTPGDRRSLSQIGGVGAPPGILTQLALFSTGGVGAPRMVHTMRVLNDQINAGLSNAGMSVTFRDLFGVTSMTASSDIAIVGAIAVIVMKQLKGVCYTWSAEDLAQINAGVPQRDACASQGTNFWFTQGHNAFWPGCGTCWCCELSCGAKCQLRVQVSCLSREHC
jgi:hypothetical protein